MPVVQRLSDVIGAELVLRDATLSVLPAKTATGWHVDRVRPEDVGAVARYHIPLISEPRAVFLLHGRSHHLAVGHIWKTPTQCMHRGINGGTADRYHVVLSVVRV